MRLFPVLFSVLFSLYSCNEQTASEKDKAAKDTVSAPVKYVKPSSGLTDTLFVRSTVAVFFNSDSIQLEKIKLQKEKNEFETEVHNCFYLKQNAIRVLKQYWAKIKIIEASGVRYLQFIKQDKSKTVIDLDKINNMCGVFLFNQKKDPELANIMNIDTALEFYFNR